MSRLQQLAERFLVDEPPNPAVRRRVHVPPSPRPRPPKRGHQLLRWMTEEADEQMQAGAKQGTVPIGKTDLKLLRYLLQWLDLMAAGGTP